MKADRIQPEYTITINHHPIHFYGVSCVLLILWAILGLMLWFKTEQNIIVIITFLGMLAITALCSYFEDRNTVLTYDENKLKIQSYGKETMIKLSEITSIRYDIFEENQGIRHSEVRLELTVTMGNKESFLNDKIERKQVKSCISGKNKKVPLMQLYSFIAEIYPDKAIGYKEELRW